MSYIGKNPKVDSVKLEGAATAASGTDEGQIYYNTGTGSISKGLKVFKNGQFVSIDKQLGDADTFHLLKASDISTAEFSAARNSTSTSFLNQNAVPFETTTASGVAGTFSNSSTGDALLTDESADLVFAYKSSGTSDDAQEYFGIPLSVPKAFRGGNVVLTFEYRTGFGTGTTATVDGDFEVAVLDKSTGNGGQTTSTNSTTDITAGSAITVASKTGLAVGQRIRLEAGSQSSIGHPDATVVEAFITSVSSTANEITISEDWDTPHASGAVVVSGWLTDVVPGQLLAADSQTNKQGKKYSIQFKTEDDTSDIVLFFQNKNTSSTISRHLFVDNILLSANKFLQANSKGKSEAYFAKKQSNFWDNSTGNGYLFNESLLLPKGDSPPLAQSKLITVADGLLSDGTTSGSVITAKEDIVLSIAATAALSAGNGLHLYYINDDEIASHSQPDGSTAINQVDISATVNAKKGDKFFFLHQAGNRNGGLYITAEPQTSNVVILESQDEIFTDWIEYTPTFTGAGSGTDTNIRYRLIAGEMQIQGYYDTSTTTATTWSMSLPSGFTIDTSVGVDSTTYLNGGRYTIDVSNNGYHGGAIVYLPGDTKVFRGNDSLYYGNGITFNPLTPVNGNAGGAGAHPWNLDIRIPIAGRNSNFNPLLSMPLQDFSSLENSFSARITSTGTITSQSGNFLASASRSALGTYTVTFASGFFSIAPSITATAEVLNHNIIAVGSITTSGATFEINDSSGTKQDKDFNITVTRQGSDFRQAPQATAAVIKPAVCVAKEKQPQNTSGGTTSSGTYLTREINTFSGETWFVSGFNGTLGASGTNTQFDLDPGTYEVMGSSIAYQSEAAFTRFASVNSGTGAVDGVVEIMGINNYLQTGEGSGSNFFSGSFTITSKTSFRVFTHTQTGKATFGGGVQANVSGREEVYVDLQIKKLK